ncbi:MAG: aldo/keto reductase [Bacteroidales bacterium]|nr:aldo/keto reductase [Bacteroidales bacterium]
MKKQSKQTRREFLSTTAKGAAVISAAGLVSSCSFLSKNETALIPMRKLGKTGLDVSILSFGGGSQFAKNENGDWQEHMNEALENGINLFDTAPSYNTYKTSEQDLGSEERYGLILPQYRDKVIISTKLESRDPSKVREEVEGSLSRLKIDYIDILLIHAINDSDDISVIEKGIYKELVALKQAGLIKYVGFSSMDSAERSKDMLDNLDIDVALLAMNATKYGSYAEVALPSAIKQNTGVIAMKVMRNLVGKGVSVEDLLGYAWGQEGVSSALIAHYGMEALKDNISHALKFQDDSLALLDRARQESILAEHSGPQTLCWARPGYVDGAIVG